MSKNLLAGESSPYLQQHKDNPVHWMPWGPAALDRARQENKPILLSVGYAACHWCHVMAHESFEDAEVARVMNDLFVPIKVDREERPDLDQIYQTALSLLGQQNGYPLTMFLTPAGDPFWGGTYFPREPRYGLPGFVDIMERIAEVFKSEKDTVEKNRSALRGRLEELTLNSPVEESEAPDPDRLLEAVAEKYLELMDPTHGGPRGAPKFPQIPLLTFLWHDFLRTGRDDSRRAVLTVLTHICQGGIYDHVGGGFARYTVDDRWLVPHFEKMLYDTAQMIQLLSEVWRREKTPLFRDRIYESLAWLLRDMRIEDAAFAAALDADSEGEEGRYYVWREAELRELLAPADLAFLKRYYDVSPQGNWDGKTILNRLSHPAPLSPEEDETAQRILGRLRENRELRVAPGRDDKVLADWNGLMIEALATAGRQFGERDWISAAERAWAFIRDKMTYQKEGRRRLYHSYCRSQARVDGVLEDYANLAAAGLKLYEVTGQKIYLKDILDFLDTLDALYWDGDRGGYFQTAADAPALILRSKAAHDNAVPAGNNVLIRVLSLAAALTGKDHYRRRCAALIRAFSGDALRHFYPFASRFSGLDFHHHGLHMVLIGTPDKGTDKGAGKEADKAAWIDAVLAAARAQLFLLDVPGPDSLPPDHPAAAASSAKDTVTALVCQDRRCLAPITKIEELVPRLRALRA